MSRLAARFDLCLDLVLNHIADASVEFTDYLAKGAGSPFAPLFIDLASMGDISQDDLSRGHIRKGKKPFRDVTFGDGSTGRVWCTFTEHQIDLNYRSPETFAFLEENLRDLSARGGNSPGSMPLATPSRSAPAAFWSSRRCGRSWKGFATRPLNTAPRSCPRCTTTPAGSTPIWAGATATTPAMR